jgi:uncharacterized membrane protein
VSGPVTATFSCKASLAAEDLTSRRRKGMRVEESIDIKRPLPDVFEYVSDVGNYPDWMAHVLEVLQDAPGAPQQSDSFIVAIKSVGRRFETPFERTTYEAGRRYTDHAVGGPVPDQEWHATFQELPGGTHLTRAVEAHLDGLLKVLEPVQKRVAERQLRKDLQTLKNLLEAQ